MATSNRMRCPKCGAEMNHHADKVDYGAGVRPEQGADPDFGGVLQQVHHCPNCGNVELRRVAPA